MYINEQAHTKQELALIKQLKEFCDQNNIELDYGGHMLKPGNMLKPASFKSYNTFQKGADLIYDNYKLGRMSFRQGPKGLQLFLVVEELYVNNSISEHVASIKLVSESNTRVKTFDEFTQAILDNQQLVEKFKEMLKKIKKFVEIINI